MSNIGALIPTKLDNPTLKAVASIPNIIGHDFMEENHVAFYLNPSAKNTYLEY